MDHPIRLKGDSNFWIRRMLRYGYTRKNYWPYWESICIYQESGKIVYENGNDSYKIVLDLY